MKRTTIALAAGATVAGAALGTHAWMQRRATTALPAAPPHTQVSLVIPRFPVLERITGGADPARPLPLVLVLHGIGADERQLLKYTALDVPARLVYVRGARLAGETPAAGYSYFAARFAGDKQAFLAQVEAVAAQLVRALDIIASQRAISRTLALGYSQGGHIAWMLATMGRFDVVLPVSGALPEGYRPPLSVGRTLIRGEGDKTCLLYTSDAADE